VALALRRDDVEAGPAGLALQALVMGSFLFVADGAALETERLRLLFLDARGNIVREACVPCTETWEMRDGWNGLPNCHFWLDGDRYEWLTPVPGSVLGEKYRFSGDIGRVLYDIGDGQEEKGGQA
jgi:hypothetical protein